MSAQNDESRIEHGRDQRGTATEPGPGFDQSVDDSGVPGLSERDKPIDARGHAVRLDSSPALRRCRPETRRNDGGHTGPGVQAAPSAADACASDGLDDQVAKLARQPSLPTPESLAGDDPGGDAVRAGQVDKAGGGQAIASALALLGQRG